MKKILSVFLTLCLLLALAPCGVLAAEPETPAGGYLLTGIAGGAGSDLEIVSAVLDLGVDFYLILGGDGSGCMRFMEAEIPLNWDDDSLIIPPTGQSPKTLELPYTFADGSLTVSTLAYSMNFRAMTDAELADYEANGSKSISGMVGALVQSLLAGMDSDLVDSLVLSLALGTMDTESEPVPEGEPSKEPVTGTVSGVEFTVLGAAQMQDEEAGDMIVFYFDAANVSDEIKAVWYYNMEACQGG